MTTGTGPPPSCAAGALHPYGARVSLRAEGGPVEAGPLLTTLLEAVAMACSEAGATLIGHIKCVLHTAGDIVFGNLTSTRSGAVIRGGSTVVLTPAQEARVDLAVLVYGLEAEVIDRLVSRTLDALLSPVGMSWEKRPPAGSSHA